LLLYFIQLYNKPSQQLHNGNSRCITKPDRRLHQSASTSSIKSSAACWRMVRRWFSISFLIFSGAHCWRSSTTRLFNSPTDSAVGHLLKTNWLEIKSMKGPDLLLGMMNSN